MERRSPVPVEYLKDESGLEGEAEGILFPASLQEMESAYASLHGGEPPTVQGSRTGICGGAVPQGGTVLSCERLARVLGFGFDEARREGFLRVEAGVTLEAVASGLLARSFDTGGWAEADRQALEAYRGAGFELCFPPRPSEQTASIGGMIACNSSGSGAYHYGELREYIEEAVVVLPGRTLGLRRGEPPGPGGLSLEGYCGAEGRPGALYSATLRLVAADAHTWGGLLFFDEAAEVLAYIEALERGIGGALRSFELFHRSVFERVHSVKEGTGLFPDFPAVRPAARFALYVELGGEDEETLMNALEAMLTHLDERYADEAVAAITAGEVAGLRSIWHSALECVGMLPRGPAVDIPMFDVLAPPGRRAELLGRIARDIEAQEVPPLLLGRIGTGHLHARLLAQTTQQAGAAQVLMETWAGLAKTAGCLAMGEFGVGALNRTLAKRLGTNRL